MLYRSSPVSTVQDASPPPPWEFTRPVVSKRGGAAANLASTLSIKLKFRSRRQIMIILLAITAIMAVTLRCLLLFLWPLTRWHFEALDRPFSDVVWLYISSRNGLADIQRYARLTPE